jgi:hypothetical protein
VGSLSGGPNVVVPRELLDDLRARLAVVVSELELGEHATAYLVACDLEAELDVELPRLEDAA